MTGTVTPPLYKYLSAATGKIVLANRTLRWSTPVTLNDPFDMQTGLNMNFDEESIVESSLGKLWQAYNEGGTPIGNTVGLLMEVIRRSGIELTRDEFYAQFEASMKASLAVMRDNLPKYNGDFLSGLAKSKILCLSEATDSVLMWSHYADQHRGIALEFGTPDGVDSPWRVARPMNYVATAPNLYDDDFLSDLLSGRVTTDVHSIMDRYIYTKGREWEYERERRIYSGDGRDPTADYEDISFHNGELFGVTFGHRTPIGDREEIASLAIALNPSVAIYQAAMEGLRIVQNRIR